MALLLQARGIRRHFGRLAAVDGVDLEIDAGQVLGLLGPNGAGKTTTLRMLLGHLRPSAGSVTLFGEPVSCGCNALAAVGAMVEGPAFYPWLSGRRNLELALACRGYGKSERRARAAAAGDELGLGEALDRRYGAYSTGLARRLGIAAAIAHDPELVVLDEPTAGLDPIATASLRDLLRRLARERGMAILLSSHLLGDVEVLADSIVLLKAGRVFRRGTVEELLAEGGERFEVELEHDDADRTRARKLATSVDGVSIVGEDGVLIVEASRSARALLVKALVEAGLPPVALVPRRRTLEEFFLEEASS